MSPGDQLCGKCGASFSAQTKFCPQCGNKVAVKQATRKRMPVLPFLAGTVVFFAATYYCLGLLMDGVVAEDPTGMGWVFLVGPVVTILTAVMLIFTIAALASRVKYSNKERQV